MAGHSFITYKNKDITYLDYRGLNTQQMLETLEDCLKKTLAKNKKMYMLSNLQDSFTVREFIKKAKEAGETLEHLTIKSAIVGLSRPQKILLNGFNAFTGLNAKAFDNEDEAKEWLVN